MVQPIFYSTNERVCKEHLTPFSPGMLEELPGWGKDCADLTLKTVMNNYTISGQNMRDSEGYSILIFVIVCFCLFFMSLIAYLQTLRWCKLRDKIRNTKKAEMRCGDSDTAE